MINWKKYADKIYVISHTINFDKRKTLEKQFIDIDLKEFTYHYSVNPNLFKPSKYIIEKKQYYCTIAHYETIKEAYELGYESIIIIEDDVHFLKDLNEIENQLNKFYNSGDIVLFDYIKMTYYNNQFCLADFYRLNRNGMKYILDNIEDHMYQIDNFWTTCNNYYYGTFYEDKQVNDICCPYVNVSDINPIISISDKRICIQAELDKDNNYQPILAYKLIGIKENINKNEYNL